MICRRGLVFGCLLLAACSIRTDGEEDEQASLCQPVMFEQSPFTHCVARPDEQSIAMDLAPEGEEEPYRSLRALVDDRGDEDIVFAMNGGMFDEDGRPVGYYVEDGRRLTVLNQNEGPGNFHMLPNGVFFGMGAQGPWFVWSTERFARDNAGRPQFATQSGPMLVVNGELHPAIDNDGNSRRIRNAVGVDASGRAHFVISEEPVSFGRMARYYRDVLNVDNALFLDGTVSSIWDPANGRLDDRAPIGPLIVVQNRAEEAA